MSESERNALRTSASPRRYAQVVQSFRRQRLVGVQHRGVLGTRGRGPQVLLACGQQIKTAFVKRLTLDLRPLVAAVGCRGHTLGQGQAGVQQLLVLVLRYHNFVLPHASWRQPLLSPEFTHGSGARRE
jgi:hypothetical protein